ncbi:MAG: glycosyltransferase [Oscillospiraceae bacterium]|nr:glycosyltransferase [Oscillospiraceae bacterium]
MKQHKKRERLLILATAMFLVPYLTWRLGWTIPSGKGPVPVVCWIVLTAVEFVGLFELAVFLYEFVKQRDVTLPAVDEAAFPDVDVFVFTINEPEELLAKTVYACKRMHYPDRHKIHVYLCDDGGRDSMRDLAERMGVNYLCRGVNTDAKAGNFNYALIKSRSPLIAIFDADMMPKENFLLHTVPYCVADERVGFVQTPQHFYRKDIFQRSLPRKNVPHNEQDYFYQVIQRTKNASNSVILAGSNTLLRRAAVEDIGGFVTGTLTEDFSTGIELEKKGYVGISIDEVLADGLPPMDFESLIKQRRRWAKGCIQSGRKTKYLRCRTLSLRQKMNYFSSIIYWYSSLKRIIYMLAPMLFCLAGIGVMRCEPWEIALFWFPLYGCISLCVYHLSGKIRSLYWTNIYETVLMPFLLPAVIQELFGFHQKTFDVTSKKQASKDRKKLIRHLSPFVVLLALNVLSLAMVLLRSYLEAGYHYVLLFAYLLVNCLYLYTACRIVVGSSANSEGALFDIQESMQYRDCAEEDFVNIRSTALGEDTIQTATYDDNWTVGTLRISRQGYGNGCIELPVRYEKNGTWSIDAAAAPDDYQEYIYFLFNR